MSVTEASHTQIPSRGMRAWKKKTSLWQWRTARCGGRLWIRSRLPGPPDDDDDTYIYPMPWKREPIRGQDYHCIFCGMQRVICNG